jgi:hypothetical protein
MLRGVNGGGVNGGSEYYYVINTRCYLNVHELSVTSQKLFYLFPYRESEPAGA